MLFGKRDAIINTMNTHFNNKVIRSKEEVTVQIQNKLREQVLYIIHRQNR